MKYEWKIDIYDIATTDGIVSVASETCGGLGVRRIRRGLYNITHINSGLKVCNIVGSRKLAFSIAERFLDIGDWTFIRFDGYRNSDPDLEKKCRAIFLELGEQCNRSGLNGSDCGSSAEISRRRAAMT